MVRVPFTSLILPHLTQLTPYQAGKPLEELERELGLTDAIKLASNENPLGPSPLALAAIRDTLGNITGVVLVFRDKTEERRAQRLLRVRVTLLEYAATHTVEELLTKTLDEAESLVNSPIGFYHFVDNDQQTLSLQAWSTRTRKEFCRA